MEIFEKAIREKLRFDSTRGQLTTEDLWDLSLEKLNEMAIEVNNKLQLEEQPSFIPDQKKRPSNLSLKLEILKHVITEKYNADKAKADRKKRREELEELKKLAETKASDAIQKQPLSKILAKIEEIKAELGEE